MALLKKYQSKHAIEQDLETMFALADDIGDPKTDKCNYHPEIGYVPDCITRDKGHVMETVSEMEEEIVKITAQQEMLSPDVLDALSDISDSEPLITFKPTDLDSSPEKMKIEIQSRPSRSKSKSTKRKHKEPEWINSKKGRQSEQAMDVTGSDIVHGSMDVFETHDENLQNLLDELDDMPEFADPSKARTRRKLSPYKNSKTLPTNFSEGVKVTKHITLHSTNQAKVDKTYLLPVYDKKDPDIKIGKRMGYVYQKNVIQLEIFHYLLDEPKPIVSEEKDEYDALCKVTVTRLLKLFEPIKFGGFDRIDTYKDATIKDISSIGRRIRIFRSQKAIPKEMTKKEADVMIDVMMKKMDTFRRRNPETLFKNPVPGAPLIFYIEHSQKRTRTRYPEDEDYHVRPTKTGEQILPYKIDMTAGFTLEDTERLCRFVVLSAIETINVDTNKKLLSTIFTGMNKTDKQLHEMYLFMRKVDYFAQRTRENMMNALQKKVMAKKDKTDRLNRLQLTLTSLFDLFKDEHYHFHYKKVTMSLKGKRCCWSDKKISIGETCWRITLLYLDEEKISKEASIMVYASSESSALQLKILFLLSNLKRTIDQEIQSVYHEMNERFRSIFSKAKKPFVKNEMFVMRMYQALVRDTSKDTKQNNWMWSASGLCQRLLELLKYSLNHYKAICRFDVPDKFIIFENWSKVEEIYKKRYFTNYKGVSSFSPL